MGPAGCCAVSGGHDGFGFGGFEGSRVEGSGLGGLGFRVFKGSGV